MLYLYLLGIETNEEQTEKYSCDVASTEIASGFKSIVQQGLHFAYHQLKKAALQFGKLFVVDRSIIDEADSYFDNLNDMQADESDADVEENDGDTFPRLDLDVESVKYKYDYTISDNTMLHSMIREEIEILLLSPTISLTGYQEEYLDLVEERESANWKSCLVFCGLFLCYFLTKSEVAIPVCGSNPMSPRMLPVIKLIYHALTQGNLIHSYFKDCLPDGQITPREAVELIKEGIPVEKYMETPAFMSHDNLEYVLEFHLTRLCSARRRSCSLYTVDGKTSVLCTDSEAILFVNIDKNTIEEKEGGAIIIRAKSCSNLFLKIISQQLNIENPQSGSLLTTYF